MLVFQGILGGSLQGCIFFDIEMPFCVIEVAFFGIEILHSVVHHLDCLPEINLCMPFWASTSCK